MTTVNMLEAKTTLSKLVEALPPIHADPFDRLLVAQALGEPLILMIHDATVARYSDTVLHV